MSKFVLETADRDSMSKLLVKFCRPITDWHLTPDGKVNVLGDCEFRSSAFNRDLHRLPMEFKKVTGDFLISSCNLDSLEGCPSFVGGTFNCSDNYLPSLAGAPEHVGLSFNCSYNRLTSLLGSPKNIGLSFNCSNNLGITSLEGCPKDLPQGDFVISWTPELPLLRLVGLMVFFQGNTDFETERLAKVERILEKYVDKFSRSNIIACQKDLIDAGFEGNASW